MKRQYEILILMNPQIPPGTSALQHGRSRRQSWFHQAHHGAVQQHLRGSSPLCTAEETRRVSFWCKWTEATSRSDQARQEVRHRNSIEQNKTLCAVSGCTGRWNNTILHTLCHRDMPGGIKLWENYHPTLQLPSVSLFICLLQNVTVLVPVHFSQNIVFRPLFSVTTH